MLLNNLQKYFKRYSLNIKPSSFPYSLNLSESILILSRKTLYNNKKVLHYEYVPQYSKPNAIEMNIFNILKSYDKDIKYIHPKYIIKKMDDDELFLYSSGITPFHWSKDLNNIFSISKNTKKILHEDDINCENHLSDYLKNISDIISKNKEKKMELISEINKIN